MLNETKKFFPIRLKKNEEEEIIRFANAQGNFTDTVRYLIEKEIAENGIRNLQEVIPAVRDKGYFINLNENITETNRDINNAEKKTKAGVKIPVREEKKVEAVEKNKKTDVKEIPDCYI